MSLLQDIDNAFIKALKAKETEKVSTFRLLKSAIKNKEIELGKKLSDEEIGQVVTKEVKLREEAITEYKKGGRKDLANLEEKEIKVLKTYLPKQLSDAEIEKIVDQAIIKTGASSLSDMGKVMGQVMPQVSGKADGAKISQIVKNKLVKLKSSNDRI